MIFSFEDYLVEKYHSQYRDVDGFVTKTEPVLPKDYQLFFAKRGFCPSCKRTAEKVSEKAGPAKHDFFSETIWQCSFCGWWEVKITFDSHFQNSDTEYRSWAEDTLYHAIIKKFNAGDLSLPLNSLLFELSKNNKVLYQIHPTKLEQLSQYVLSSYFNCEVLHVGKSGDGGKDLILILKDDPVLVQIKRRSKENSVESVSTIRDILGTLFIEKSRRGMVMSTANHFSKPSLKIKKDLLEDGRLDYFELIDFQKLCQMLKLIQYRNRPRWLELHDKFRDETR